MSYERFEPMAASAAGEYLLMARALISQGAVDVDSPRPELAVWAQRAAHAHDAVLVEAVAKLAEGTAAARSERYIELQLIAPGTTANDPIVDLEVADRFAILRLMARDHRLFRRHGLAVSLDGAIATLYSSFDDAITAARSLRSEPELTDLPTAVLAYACIFNPILPAEFLEEGTDPLGPAREYAAAAGDDERSAIQALVASGAPLPL